HLVAGRARARAEISPLAAPVPRGSGTRLVGSYNCRGALREHAGSIASFLRTGGARAGDLQRPESDILQSMREQGRVRLVRGTNAGCRQAGAFAHATYTSDFGLYRRGRTPGQP